MDTEPEESGTQSEGELISRPPSLEDLVGLCRELNERGAKYVVVGGFAIRAAGYVRETRDVDYLIDTSLDNETKVRSALATLPDNAVRDLKPGEVGQYLVVRVADEFVGRNMPTRFLGRTGRRGHWSELKKVGCRLEADTTGGRWRTWRPVV